MNITVIIPTYKRVQKLKTCLESLANQQTLPYQIIITYREDDDETYSLIKTFRNRLPIESIRVESPGVVHAESIALKHTKGEIIAFIDDDGIAPESWISTIIQIFSQNKDIVGLGGPDFIIQDPTPRRFVKRVGQITWFGKVIGNHHHQSNTQYVQALKGTNMAFLASQICELDPVLNGPHSEGNGIFWELDLCLNTTKKSGGTLLFSPTLEIKHDSDHSHVKLYPTIKSGAHNLIYVLLKHHHFFQKFIFLNYYIFIGNTQLMGFFRFIVDLTKIKPLHSIKYYLYSQIGLIRGLKSFCQIKRKIC